MVFFTLLATKITAKRTKNEPKLAEMLNIIFELENIKKLPPNIELPSIKIATPKLAPELIPKTYGPASGFLNKVCINNPLIAKPEPTNTAVIALGIR